MSDGPKLAVLHSQLIDAATGEWYESRDDQVEDSWKALRLVWDSDHQERGSQIASQALYNARKDYEAEHPTRHRQTSHFYAEIESRAGNGWSLFPVWDAARVITASRSRTADDVVSDARGGVEAAHMIHTFQKPQNVEEAVRGVRYSVEKDFQPAPFGALSCVEELVRLNDVDDKHPHVWGSMGAERRQSDLQAAVAILKSVQQQFPVEYDEFMTRSSWAANPLSTSRFFHDVVHFDEDVPVN